MESGDRFFWLNQDFDPATAQMISQTTLADIIERDTGTPAEQPNVFIAEQRHTSDVAASDPTMPQLVIGVDTSGATIAGGSADDTIVPGLGLNQLLIGGGGSDVFQYNGSGHTDSINDWNASDTIQFQPTETDAALTALLQTTVDVTDPRLPLALLSPDHRTFV